MNIVSALQVVNMVKFILQFLLLTVSVFNNVLCENNLNSFKVMTKIQGHKAGPWASLSQANSTFGVD